MARSRNIKPGFFDNTALAKLPPLARLLFIGLWCQCDREGRIEDNPERIRARVLPYDKCDVDKFLELLSTGKDSFLIRYSIGEERFIQVRTWNKHQNPHKKEAASSIQAPDLHGAGTGQALPFPARAGLIPDSLNLIPDSLNPESGTAPTPTERTSLLEAYRHAFLVEWQKPCECCGMEFKCSDVDLGCRVWISLVDSGTITTANLPEVIDGLERYRSSKDWHKNSGQYVHSVPAFLGLRTNGTPGAPRWNDRPQQKGAYD